VDLFNIQLSTCIDFLDLLTAHRGIASDGYRRRYTIFPGKKGQISGLCWADKLFCVKFGYLLDWVFQSFIMDLMTHFDSSRPPIHEARCVLDGKQAEMVNDGLQGIAFGLVPQIHLPASLSKPATMAALSGKDTFSPATKKKKKQKGAKEQELEQRETSCTTPPSNSTPIAAWLLHKGKSCKDFFNTKSSNTADWPRFAHHKQKARQQCPICMKFQTLGNCVWGCNRLHIDPNKIDPTKRDKITSRPKKLYSGQSKDRAP
jgi:hypothetical protein